MTSAIQQQQNSVVTNSVGIQNALCKATVIHLESHTTRAQWVCSGAENSAISDIVKLLRQKLERHIFVVSEAIRQFYVVEPKPVRKETTSDTPTFS